MSAAMKNRSLGPPIVTARRALTRISYALSVVALVLTAPGATIAQVLTENLSNRRSEIPAQGSYAFLNVNVLPMDTEIVLADQTVVVEAGRITAIGPATETFRPSAAITIDGRDKYLMPGLAEMHGHLPTNVADAEDFLFLYLAGGATTVRGMLGHPSQLEIRRRVRAGELLGPRMWLAAPALRGSNVPDAATADRLVREAKESGYDLIKIQEGLSAEAYSAIVATATELGLPWGGMCRSSSA
jgi:hypothetical protein